MSNPRQSVRAGQRLETFPYQAWNDFLRAGADLAERDAVGNENDAVDFSDGTTILVKNNTAADLTACAVLAVGAPIVSPVASLGEVIDQPNLVGTAPAGAESIFCITQEPIPIGGLGRAKLAGITWVQINVTDNSHGYAEPVAGDTAKLVSSAAGTCRIVWKDGTGIGWAMVRFDWGVADLTHYGVVSTIRQDFAGFKRFDSLSTGGRYGSAGTGYTLAVRDSNAWIQGDGSHIGSIDFYSPAASVPNWPICKAYMADDWGEAIYGAPTGVGAGFVLAAADSSSSESPIYEVLQPARNQHILALAQGSFDGNSAFGYDGPFSSGCYAITTPPGGTGLPNFYPGQTGQLRAGGAPIQIYNLDYAVGGYGEIHAWVAGGIVYGVSASGGSGGGGSGGGSRPLASFDVGRFATTTPTLDNIAFTNVTLQNGDKLTVIVAYVGTFAGEAVNWGGTAFTSDLDPGAVGGGLPTATDLQFWSYTNTGSAATHDVHITFSSFIAAVGIMALAVRVVNLTTAAADKTASNTGTSGNPSTGTTGTTATAAEYLQAADLSRDSTGTPAYNNSFTADQTIGITVGGHTWTLSEAFRIVAATGTYTTTDTGLTSSNWGGGIVTYK